MQRFAHLLIQRNFLFAAQTDFPCAGIVASLRIHLDTSLRVGVRLLLFQLISTVTALAIALISSGVLAEATLAMQIRAVVRPRIRGIFMDDRGVAKSNNL
jgi:hypothetical protein